MEVNHGEKAVIHAKAEKELQTRMSPGNPESQKSALSLFRTTSGDEISAPGLQQKTKSFRLLDKTQHNHASLLSKEVAYEAQTSTQLLLM